MNTIPNPNFEDRCDANPYFGWFCNRAIEHNGPCALWPRWWNHSRAARAFRRKRHL